MRDDDSFDDNLDKYVHLNQTMEDRDSPPTHGARRGGIGKTIVLVLLCLAYIVFKIAQCAK